MQTYGLDQNRVQQLTGYNFSQPQGIQQLVNTPPPTPAAPEQVTDQQIQDWWAQHQYDTNLADEVQQGMGTYGLSADRIKQLTGYDAVGQGPKATTGTPVPNTNAPPPPTWNDAYAPWDQWHRATYGIEIDRPWNTDSGTSQAKTDIDNNYIAAIDAYNKQYGTDIKPDQSVLGVNAQPSHYTPKPSGGGGFFDKLSSALGTDGGGSGLLHDISKTLGTAGDGNTFLGIRDQDAMLVVAVVAACYGYTSPELFAADAAAGTVAVTAGDAAVLASAGVPAVATTAGAGTAVGTAGAGTAVGTAGAAGAAGAATTTAAPGLAGMLGMKAGTGATMLNAGALGTAKGVVVDKKNIGDALIGGAKSALTSGVGSVFSDAVAAAEIPGISEDMANVLGNTGAQALVNGPDAAKWYFINGMVDLGMNSIAKDIGLDKLPPPMQQAAKTTMSSVLQGKNPTDALISIAAGAAINSVFGDSVSKIPGYSSLSPAGKQAALAVAGDVLRGKSATGDLFNLAVAEAGAETRRQLKAGNTVVSKDAAPLPLDQVAALNEAGLTDTTPPTTMDYIDTVQGGAPATDLGTVNVSGSKMPWDFQVPDQVPDLPVNLGADQREIQLAPVTVTGKRDPEIQLEPVTVVGSKMPWDFPVPDQVPDLPVDLGPNPGDTTLPTVTVTAPREPPVFEAPELPQVKIPPVDLGPAPKPAPKPSVPVKTPSKAAPTPAPSTEAPAAGYAPSGGYPNLATSHYAGKDFRSDVMKLDKYGRLIDDPHKGLSVTQAGKELDLPSTETVADAVGTVDNTTGLTMGPLGIPTADSMAALFGLE
jgi:hypothetical protein